MNLLVATTNPHKVVEITAILQGLPVQLSTLADVPAVAEPEETGSTFAENARLKARYYSRHTGRFAVAEDSGLEIDALDGAPGILSARFNGDTYPDKFAVIYERLRARQALHSPARFVCALAVAHGDQITFEARGTVEGRIADAPAGEDGFGYDPIFFYPPYGKTLGQVTAREKAAVSHRGHAFRALRAYLDDQRNR